MLQQRQQNSTLAKELESGNGLEMKQAVIPKDKQIIFAFRAYPWHILRLNYRRTNRDEFHVRGYKEEGTITTQSE